MSTEPKEFHSTPEQLAFLKDVIGLKNVVCSGGAGTGKSTLLRQMREHFKDAYLRLGVVGSTGIAAVNVGGLTLHTWAGLGMGDESESKLINRVVHGDNRRAYENIKYTNHLAIDEISMVPASLLDKVDALFRKVRGREEPFGGMQIIAFGDFLQLPPVSKDNDNPERFAFEGKAWKAGDFQTHILTRVFRQGEQEFADALNDIRFANITPAVSSVLNAAYRKPDPTPELPPVILTTHNADADAINHRRLALIEAKQFGYDADDVGTERAKRILERCLMPARLELKEGAQVMCTYNVDQERGIINGSLGIVVGFTGEHATRVPIVQFSNGIVETMEPIKWTIRENELEIGSRTQIPLRLAWAITVHKSQGMTLDKVEVHLARAFEYGQAYVALSRTRTREGLFIANGSRASIKAHPKAVSFYSNVPSNANR